MAVYDLPLALRSMAWEFGLARSGTQFRSPYSGTLQAVDFIADRWQVGMMLPPRLFAQAGQCEAFFNRLVGGVNRVRLWHQARPVPRGTLRGSPTLSGAAARGNASIAITGAVAYPNLLRYSGFELDGNADGVADGWQLFSGGATGALTPSLGAGGSSGLAQRLNAAALGTAVGDFAGVRTATLVGVQPGAMHTLAADLGGTLGCQLALSIDWYTAGDVFISAATTAAAAGPALERRSLSALAPATAAKADLLLYMRARTGGPALTTFLADSVQFEAAAAATTYAGPPTLKAGDMLGCGGQLFQVAEDVTLNDAGAGNVQVVNRSRGAIAGGSAVTWLRPTAEFYMPAQASRFAFQPQHLQAVAFDLEEFIG